MISKPLLEWLKERPVDRTEYAYVSGSALVVVLEEVLPHKGAANSQRFVLTRPIPLEFLSLSNFDAFEATVREMVMEFRQAIRDAMAENVRKGGS